MLGENMEETNGDGSLSHLRHDDPLELESQGCHKMCRLCACLVQEMNVVNIFTDDELNLIVKINRFLADKVYPDDGLPPDVCKACVVKLNFCDRTVSSFITADRKLRELFEIDEKSKILLEIPIIDKEQESEGHEFEMLELQNCCDVSMADDTNDSYSKELYEQKYSPTAASTDEKYAFPETKFLPAVSSSQYEIFSGDCISKCSDSMVNYDPSIKKEVYAEQICGENILKTDDFEDNSALENMYNGCNDVAFEQEVGACVEYISEETLEVSEVLEEKMNSENEDEFLDLHAVENQQEFIDVESHNLSSEACIDAKSENFFGSSVHNQLETGLEMSPILCDLCGENIYRHLQTEMS